MVDFTLSPSELAVRDAARTFASAHLSTAKAAYTQIPSHAERFQSLQPLYAEAVKAGLIKCQIPTALGGTSSSLLEAAILVEEMSAVERAASLTIFGTGLGLTPLCLAIKPQFAEFLNPFLSGEGTPLASLVFTEPGGVVSPTPRWRSNFLSRVLTFRYLLEHQTGKLARRRSSRTANHRPPRRRHVGSQRRESMGD